MKHTRVATATALVATLILGTAACGNAAQADKPVPRAEETVATVAAEPAEEATEEETDDPVKDLDAPVEYETGLKFHLTGFERGKSSNTAAPENTPYISFMLHLDNASAKRLNMSQVMIDCQYGEPGQEGEQIFDSANGIEGTSSTSLLPGKTAKAKIACAMPKDETYLQIEITPTWDSETAIFSGRVPKA